MPITRIPYPNSLPTDQQDFVKQNNLLIQHGWRVNEPAAISGANVTKGAVFQIGGVIYYTDADTAIGGAASNYVKIAPDVGGATCTATFVANLAGVSWNQAYNGYYDVGGNLYVFNEAVALIAGQIGSVVQRYLRQDRTGDVYVGRDLIGGRNINIKGLADGDREIDFASDASLLWSEAADEFVLNKGINLGTKKVKAAIQFDKTVTTGNQALGAGGDWYPSAGFYQFSIGGTAAANVLLEIYIGGAWRGLATAANGSGFVYCDGSNVRFHNYHGSNSATIYWNKYTYIS